MPAAARDLEQVLQAGQLVRAHELRLRRAAAPHRDDHRGSARVAQQRRADGSPSAVLPVRLPVPITASTGPSVVEPLGRRRRQPDAGRAVLEAEVERHRGEREALLRRRAPDRPRGRRPPRRRTAAASSRSAGAGRRRRGPSPRSRSARPGRRARRSDTFSSPPANSTAAIVLRAREPLERVAHDRRMVLAVYRAR